tara:strand:+ start:2724 stop:3317 length:594 start_codon:yes stop_codon:yes gene_type:complete
MSCNKDIAKSFSIDCTSVPVKGLIQSVTIMNRTDIDRGATVFNADGVTIEGMTLKAGAKRAYLMDGVKNLLNAQATFVSKDDTFDAWNHTLSGYIADLNPANLAEIQAYTNGAEICAIVRTKYEGADGTGSTAYKVLGYEVGMSMTESVFDANENGGLPFTLGNKDGYENNQFPYAFFITDLATTEAAVLALQTPTA